MDEREQEKLTFDMLSRLLKESKKRYDVSESSEDFDFEPIKLKSWDDLLEEIFIWFQMDANTFIPVEVNYGRKFRGFGYILSFKPVTGIYRGDSYETMVYKVWDPKNRCIGEFNTNMLNLFSADASRYKSRWNLDIKVSNDKVFKDFKEYFMSLVNRATVQCGSDYRHMKNYFSACTRFDYDGRTRTGLPEELVDQIVDLIENPVD